MMNWLKDRRGFITGATGWFGSWICRYLDSIGAEYIPLLHTPDVDITNFPIPQDIDYIIHLSPGPVDRVIECAWKNQVEALLFTSSGAVYHERPTAYSREKRFNEMLLLDGFPGVKIARCFCFMGEGIPDHFVASQIARAAVNGEPITLWSANSLRTYLYMGDMVQWLLKILVEGDGIYDVGGDEEVSIMELAQRFNKNKQSEIHVIQVESRNPIYLPDTERALQLGCRATVNLDQMIDKTTEWVKNEKRP